MIPRKLTAGLGLVAIAAAGCITPPTKLIEQATQAQEDAKTVNASRYAPEAAAAAEAAFQAAETERALQDKKFMPLRNYDVVESKLTEAVAAYGKAKNDALQAKSALKGPVRTLMKDANQSVDSVEQLLAKAIARGANVDLTAWQNNVAELRQALADATQAQNSDDLVTAKAKLEWAVTRSSELQLTMQEQLAGRAP
jgi:hypothetical protein